MEKSELPSSHSHRTNSMTEYYWDCIGPDLTEIILSNLPIPSIIVSASVCKFWNSIIHSNSFKTRISYSKKLPWFFLSGQNKNYPNKNKLFAFIPESDNWIALPNATFLSKHPFTAAFINKSVGGIGKVIFEQVLINCQTSPLAISTCNPLIGSCNQIYRRVVTVGGIDLVDIRGCLAVDLPDSFRPGNSLCSVFFKGKLYVFGIYSNFISYLDLEKRFWSDIKTLRPPGLMLSFLISCEDQLVLAGLCCVNYELRFNLWRIDDKTLEFSEIGIMPGELLSSFLDSEEDMRFPRWKCVGFSNLVYVFSEESIACVCEISNSGKCRWRRVPNLPECVDNYDKVISFSCHVSLDDFLGNGKN